MLSLFNHMIVCENCREKIEQVHTRNYLKFGWKKRFAMKILKKFKNYLPRGYKNRIRKLTIDTKYFGNKRLAWCFECGFGFTFPQFEEEDLNEYYDTAYWDNRNFLINNNSVLDQKNDEGVFLQLGVRKYKVFEKRTFKHLALIDKYITESPLSILDFGSGHCVASYHLSKRYTSSKVIAYDKSNQSREICEILDIDFSNDLKDIGTKFDFIYSSHSIEHVPNIRKQLSFFKNLLNRGGYLFFEFPNIVNFRVFSNFVHTPHTYMLNRKSIQKIGSMTGYKLVYSEEYGNKWEDLLAIKDESILERKTELIAILRSIS